MRGVLPKLASGLVKVPSELLIVLGFGGTYVATKRYGLGISHELVVDVWLVFFLSLVPLQVCCSMFYGKELMRKYDHLWRRRGLRIPPAREFERAMTLDISMIQKVLGYTYAVLQPTNSVALGVGLAMFLREQSLMGLLDGFQ